MGENTAGAAAKRSPSRADWEPERSPTAAEVLRELVEAKRDEFQKQIAEQGAELTGLNQHRVRLLNQLIAILTGLATVKAEVV